VPYGVGLGFAVRTGSHMRLQAGGELFVAFAVNKGV
jgi:hypothetical protein